MTNSSVDGRKVIGIRFEDVPNHCRLSFTKFQFVEVVRKAKSGKPNVKRTFPGEQGKKATAVFIDCLPESIVDLVEGMLHGNHSTTFNSHPYITESMSTTKKEKGD